MRNLQRIGCAAQILRGQRTRQRGGKDRCRAADRIDADDQFAGIEGAGDRCAESRRNRRSRTATDDQPQIVAAEVEDLSEK